MSKVTSLSENIKAAPVVTQGDGVNYPDNVRQMADPSELDRKLLRDLNLVSNPFPVVPDVNNIFMAQQVEIIISEVAHMIHRRRGFIVITGEVGLGKSTIVRRLLRDLGESGVHTALIFNTFMKGADLIAEMNKDFGLNVEDKSLSAQMDALNAFLLDRNSHGQNCAIIIDDAQQLTLDSLELIRQISNLETDSDKLVQILLVGQPELEEKLASHQIRQLKSRITLFRRVKPYNLDEVRRYVTFKMQRAGGDGTLKLTNGAYSYLWRITGGNPRKINIIMDRCLYAAIAYETRTITKSLMRRLVDELDPTTAAKKKISFRRIGYGLLVGMVLLASGAWYTDYAQIPIEYPLMTQLQQVNNDLNIIETAQSEIVAQSDETVAAIEPVESIAIEETIIEEPILSFLRDYGLEKYSEEFKMAYEEGSLEMVAEQIADQTGIRLIALSVAPEAIRSKYPLLRFGSSEKDEEHLLLFWKPLFQIDSFYIGYQGAEIVELQLPLRNGGFYRDQVDGVVGVNTRMAIALFQQSVGLDPTGMPDKTTLFMLEQL